MTDFEPTTATYFRLKKHYFLPWLHPRRMDGEIERVIVAAEDIADIGNLALRAALNDQAQRNAEDSEYVRFPVTEHNGDIRHFTDLIPRRPLDLPSRD